LTKRRPVNLLTTRLDSALYAGVALAVLSSTMLKIQRKANGDVVFTLSGRLEAANLLELSTLIAAEPSGRALVLDLEDVVLADREILQFLQASERNGITLRNCPLYIREWIDRDQSSSCGQDVPRIED
jgi:hypothetical protein